MKNIFNRTMEDIKKLYNERIDVKAKNNAYLPVSEKETKVLIIGDRNSVVNLDVIKENGEFSDMEDYNTKRMDYKEVDYNNRESIFGEEPIIVSIDFDLGDNIEEVITLLISGQINESDVCIVVVNNNIFFIKSTEKSICNHEFIESIKH